VNGDPGRDERQAINTTNSEGPIGFDVPAVEGWLGDHTEVRTPCTWQRLTGGHSNLTYLLTDTGGHDYVIRRPPLGELLPKAHDMHREFRIIDALHPAGIPTPRPVGYCDDRGVCERHFYVMSRVHGEALYAAAQTAPRLDVAARRRVGESFIEVLAAIHSIDPDRVGLARLGRPDGYVARQLATWYGSWVASAEAADYDDDRVHRLHDLLTSNLPAEGPARVVHGDYGVHNVMIDDGGEVVAVLDWEIATLGDPLADFAYALNAWSEAGDSEAARADAPTALEGFATRDDLAALYAERTGADLSNLSYYRSFNSLKTACILHGVYARYRRGQKSSEGVDVDALFTRMQASIALSEQHAHDAGLH